MIYRLKSNISLEGNAGFNVLTARGITNIEAYLNPIKDMEYNPLLLNNISKAAICLEKHLTAGNKIFIQVDSDADGYCSSAIMYQYIKNVQPDADIEWRIHEGKQHGIIIDTIPEQVSLVIIPDAGSNQYDQHIELEDRGVDIIILDHHMADIESPNAIVVNNQLSENYPNKSLCGAGVTYKFCQLYDTIHGFNYAEEYIDLAAVALVGDMMDLRDLETRYIIETGLKKKNKNKFLQAAINARAFSIGDILHLKPVDIAFYIVPLINALIRVGKQSEKEILFGSMITGDKLVPSTKRGAGSNDTEVFAEQAVRICTNAHSRQAKAREKALEFIDIKISKFNLADNQIIFVPIEDDEDNFDTTLTGLIAMQVTSKYRKPVIIARKDSNDVWRGSARGNNGTIGDLRQFFLDSGYFLMAEGHALAHGIAIEDKNVQPFLRYANEKLADFNFHENTYGVDFILNANNVHFQQSIMDIGVLNNLWGQGVEEPLIAIEDLRISKKDIQIIGKTEDTIKITVGNVTLIKFKDKDFGNELLKYGFVDLTIVGKANINQWNGMVSPQIFIVDYIIKGNNFDF
jgi:single-stranded-DNA-specific exonuclease